MTEEQLAAAEPATVRWYQALYFYRAYRKASGPPQDSYFEMTCNFDAFLWALGSIRDLSTPQQRTDLGALEVYNFILGSRHATTHQGVLAAPRQLKLPGRPFSRVIQIGPEEGAYFRIEIDWFEALLAQAGLNHPGGKYGFERAKAYLVSLRQKGQDKYPIHLAMEEALESVRVILGLPEERPLYAA
jgi:hypothetical protein